MTLADIEKYAIYLTTAYQKVVGLYRTNKRVYAIQVKKSIKNIHELSRKVYSLENTVLSQVLKQIKDDFDVKETLFVTNISTPASLFKIIKIPQMQQNEIKTWLDENLTDIVKTSIPIDKSLFSYKVIAEKEELSLFFALFNKAEIEQLQAEFKKNDFLLYALSPGLSDLHNKIEETSSLYIKQPDNHNYIVYKGDELLYYNQIPSAFHKDEQDNQKLEVLYQKYLKEDLDNLTIEKQQWKEFNPDNESDGFDAAKALTKRAFMPTSASLDILASEEPKEYFWKQLFLKPAILLGGIVFVLYLLGYGSGLVFANLRQGVAQQAEEIAPKTAEVRRLKHTKNILLKDLSEARQMKALRSKSSVILDAVAFHITKDCWLTEIKYEKNETNYISGMSKTREAVNLFLNELEKDQNLKQVKLQYMNRIPMEKMFRKWKLKSGKYIEFRISFRY